MSVWDKNTDWKDIERFAQNRTLYVDQFNDDGPVNSQERITLHAKTIEDVFHSYKPCMDIELKNEDGESVIEHFSLHSIEDFEDDSLIAQCELLKTTEERIENYDNIIHQLERNQTLRTAIKDGTANGESIKDDFNIWRSVLETCGTEPGKAIVTCLNGRKKAEECLRNNLFAIHEALFHLEITYRTLDSYYSNAGQGEVDCIYLMNVRKKGLKLSDSDDTVSIKKELEKYYDRLDLKDSYSLLVIPGYLGDSSVIRSWANIAFKSKVILVTDFEDSKSFIDLKDTLKQANPQGQDMPLSNVVMTCNYILGRKKSELADETDDIYIPGSGALTGRMANTSEISIAQGVVGREYGSLNNVNGTRISLLRSEIEFLIGQGVIPLVEFDGHTIAFSNRSLYNGSLFSLQEYPIVRVFDWVKKVLMNYMHEITLETWNPYTSSQKLKDKIHEFLNHYRGYKNLFSNYKLGNPTQDPETKIVTVDISITPFYVGKNFTIKLTADEKKNIDAETIVES